MIKNGIVRCAAAAAISAMMFISAGITASADEFVDPAVAAGLVDENGNVNSAGSNNNGSAPETADESEETVSFTVPRTSLAIRCGISYTIKPTVIDPGAGVISFASDNPDIVSVSDKGRITANAPGVANVILTSEDGYSVSVSVKVVEKNDANKKPAEKIFFSNDSHTMNVGEKWRAAARVSPKGCSYSVKYQSSDEGIVTAAKNGELTAVGAGKCTVTITTDNGLSDTMEIEVLDPQSPYTQEYIEFKADSVTIPAGEKKRPGISVYPEGADYTITYSSADTSIAKVSAGGTITGVAPGITQVTASSGALYDVIDVVITDGDALPEELTNEYDEAGNILPSRIEFNVSSDSLRIGETMTPSVRAYPDGAVYTLAYFSSDPTVATVSHDGCITAVGDGSAIITVVSNNDKTDSFCINVYQSRYSGIDISKWQGDIDWEVLSANPEVEFVMIRASYGQEDVDKRLEQNVAGCEQYGIPYGFYHYLYAKNVEEAEIEADFFLSTVKNYRPTYPLVLDIEESFYQEMTKEEVTDIVCTFMEKLENAGYYAMIYSFAKFYDDCLIQSRVNVYDNWVACWGDEQRLSENFGYAYGMWQYSESGQMEGIPENVDLDYCYKNYPYIIMKYHLNNLG